METIRIDRNEWTEKLAEVSRHLEKAPVMIEVDALNIGSQVEVSHAPLLGLDYDHKSDVIEIDVEGLEDLVYKPTAVWFTWEGPELHSIEIEDASGEKHIIRFEKLLPLPRK